MNKKKNPVNEQDDSAYMAQRRVGPDFNDVIVPTPTLPSDEVLPVTGKRMGSGRIIRLTLRRGMETLFRQEFTFPADVTDADLFCLEQGINSHPNFRAWVEVVPEPRNLRPSTDQRSPGTAEEAQGDEYENV